MNAFYVLSAKLSSLCLTQFSAQLLETGFKSPGIQVQI